jgi:hypothetical protein
MAKICSLHQGYELTCRLCNTDIREVFPDYDQKVAEAKAAGTHVCECGFEYYKTTDTCPLCSKKRSLK